MTTWQIKGKPFEAQIEALNRTKHEPHGFAYFMEMGLGKTAVTLAEFVKLKNDGKVDVLVIACPHSLKQNWADEVKFWTEGGLTTSIWPKFEDADVYIFNYEAFSVGGRTGEAALRGLCGKKRVYLALDESTQIKKHNSVRTKSLLGTARMCSYTRILSGAPMVQGPQDIWAQLKFIGAMKGINFFQFRNRFCLMGGYMGKKIIGANPVSVSELHRILDTCSFRAKKMDWLDIPEKTYFTRTIEMSPQQKRHYKSMLVDFITYVNGQEVDAAMVVTQMGKLQQISSNFVYDEDGVPRDLGGPNRKLNEIKQILDDEIDGKLIVVSYFAHSTQVLLSELEEYGVVGIYGGQSSEEIAAAKEDFNRGDARVIVCQESAAKYGHTLLGTEDMPCCTTVFYENSFSMDDRVQIEDRNHRIGQRFTVNIIDMVCSDIEAKVIKALQQKQDIAEAIIDAIKVQRI